MGTLEDPLAIAWGASGTSWGVFETPWRSLGDHLGVTLDTLGSSWGQLGAPRDSHKLSKWPWETSWGPLRITFEASKAFTKRFAAMCQNLQIYCKVLQNSRFGGSKIHLKSSSESITATKMVPRYQSFANLRATFPKNRSKIVQDAPDAT